MKETQSILLKMGFKNLNTNVWDSDIFGVFILHKEATPKQLAEFIYKKGLKKESRTTMNKVRICYQTVAAPSSTEMKVDEILAFSKSHEILSIEPVLETMEIEEILRYIDEEFTGENLFTDYRESAKEIAKGINLKPKQDVIISIVEKLLEMPDILIDSVQNENTNYDAKSIAELIVSPSGELLEEQTCQGNFIPKQFEKL